MAIAAPAALAGSAGGVAAVPVPAAPSTPSAPKPRLHLSPVTARSQRLTYSGPVFQRTSTGELQPYQPLVAAAAAPATPTGGSPVGGATSAGSSTSVLVGAAAKPQLVVP